MHPKNASRLTQQLALKALGQQDPRETANSVGPWKKCLPNFFCSPGALRARGRLFTREFDTWRQKLPHVHVAVHKDSKPCQASRPTADPPIHALQLGLSKGHKDHSSVFPSMGASRNATGMTRCRSAASAGVSGLYPSLAACLADKPGCGCVTTLPTPSSVPSADSRTWNRGSWKPSAAATRLTCTGVPGWVTAISLSYKHVPCHPVATLPERWMQGACAAAHSHDPEQR